MKKVIVEFIKNKIVEIETAYAQNYVAKKEIESKPEQTPKDAENIAAADFNMNKAVEKLAWYKKLLKEETTVKVRA